MIIAKKTPYFISLSKKEARLLSELATYIMECEYERDFVADASDEVSGLDLVSLHAILLELESMRKM